jgi:hypothetical protein
MIVVSPETAPPRVLRWTTPVVLTGYVAAALALTWSWWTPLGGRVTAVNEPDAVLFSWLLSATPRALANGRFPLFSDLLNHPAGVNLMWNNGMALPGLVLAPVTYAFGGLATVTVATTIGLASSAGSAYLCLRALTVRVVPAALGGALFGFSPAMVAQSLGHPDLMLNPLVPVMVLLSVRLLVDEHPRRRTAVLLGVTAGAQVLIGEEVLFGTGIAVALLVIALAASRPRHAAARARVVTGRALLALGVFLLVAGGPLAFQLWGPLPQTGSPFTTAYFSADLANYVVPTGQQALAPDAAIARSAAFAGGPEERTAFLGWPLLVASAVALVAFGRVLRVRVALLAALAMGVLALGDRLTIDGKATGVPLPWGLVTDLPGFEHVLANRFALFTAGLVGAGLAFALDEAFRQDRAVRAIAALTAAIALLPLVPAPLAGRDAPAVPAFFTTRAAAELACPGGSTLVLPYPGPNSTDPMVWQEAAGMRYAMPGGYFIGPAADGHAYVGGQPSATGRLFDAVRAGGDVPPITPGLQAAFRADLAGWNACSVVLGPSPRRDALLALATGLIGRAPEAVDGVSLWRNVG